MSIAVFPNDNNLAVRLGLLNTNRRVELIETSPFFGPIGAGRKVAGYASLTPEGHSLVTSTALWNAGPVKAVPNPHPYSERLNLMIMPTEFPAAQGHEHSPTLERLNGGVTQAMIAELQRLFTLAKREDLGQPVWGCNVAAAARIFFPDHSHTSQSVLFPHPHFFLKDESTRKLGFNGVQDYLGTVGQSQAFSLYSLFYGSKAERLVNTEFQRLLRESWQGLESTLPVKNIEVTDFGLTVNFNKPFEQMDIEHLSKVLAKLIQTKRELGLGLTRVITGEDTNALWRSIYGNSSLTAELFRRPSDIMDQYRNDPRRVNTSYYAQVLSYGQTKLDHDFIGGLYRLFGDDRERIAREFHYGLGGTFYIENSTANTGNARLTWRNIPFAGPGALTESMGILLYRLGQRSDAQIAVDWETYRKANLDLINLRIGLEDAPIIVHDGQRDRLSKPIALAS